MTTENEKKLKLRFKLKTGEEFEAEGDLTFISTQKDLFLGLISPKQTTNTYKTSSNTIGSRIEPIKKHTDTKLAYSQKPLSVLPRTYSFNTAENQPEGRGNNYNYQALHSTRDQRGLPDHDIKNTILQPDLALWDKIAYIDGDDIIIRRKDKNIKPQGAALIILGAAKVLKEGAQMTALELSKSMKLSGYLKENERLDRVLGPEIKESCIMYEGSKRNRVYRITQKGMAKAFTNAERALFADDNQNKY